MEYKHYTVVILTQVWIWGRPRVEFACYDSGGDPSPVLGSFQTGRLINLTSLFITVMIKTTIMVHNANYWIKLVSNRD